MNYLRGNQMIISQEQTKTTMEMLPKIVNSFRDISGWDFWKERYHTKKSDPPKEYEASRNEMDQAAEKAIQLLTRYDASPGVDTAKPAINYCILDSNITFSLVKLRKIIYDACQKDLTERQIETRLNDLQSILRECDVPVKLKPLQRGTDNLLIFVEQEYRNYSNLGAKEEGSDLAKMVFNDIYWPVTIKIELFTKEGKRIEERHREEMTLRNILYNKEGFLV